MPTRRRKIAPEQRARLTAKALEAWHVGDWHALNRELGLNVHETSPFDARSPAPPEWAGASYRRAFELRQALIEQGGPPGRVGRHGDPLGPARPQDPPRHHRHGQTQTDRPARPTDAQSGDKAKAAEIERLLTPGTDGAKKKTPRGRHLGG